jgi:hypothetical protein
MDFKTAFFETPIAGLVLGLMLVMFVESIVLAYLARKARRPMRKSLIMTTRRHHLGA